MILDWVPSHFPNDEHGLAYFDGTHLYEHADPRQGFHPDWKSAIFNYGRNEVRSFLTVERARSGSTRTTPTACASTRSRRCSTSTTRGSEGEWIPNAYGGRENLGRDRVPAPAQRARLPRRIPDVQTIAEESTAWPMVSRPTDMGGLGFGLKWDMGWMHDTLEYFAHDPIHRRHHHGELTFRALYAFTENFVLPLSHDEVVHGKGSLLAKMPGDEWQKFANLRLLYGYMYAQPGKKLLFMGGEFGQRAEWNHEQSLDWHLLDHPLHAGAAALGRATSTATYRGEPALHELDFEPRRLRVDRRGDAESSVLSFLRRGASGDTILCVVQLHAGAAARTTASACRARALARGRSTATRRVRRQRPGQPRRRRGRCRCRCTAGARRSLLTLPPLSVVLLRHEGPSSSS